MSDRPGTRGWVRKLAVCRECQELGAFDGLGHQLGVPNVLRLSRGHYAHARCILRKHGEAFLLSLPSSQLDRVELSEVGARIMMRLLERLP